MVLLNYNPPQSPQLDVVFRDNHIVVFNKPSGLLTVPGKQAIHKDSLAVRAARVWPNIGVVHRLDMATSGLLVWALEKKVHGKLAQQFEKRTTSKEYIARIFGHPVADSGVVDLPLICDWPNRPKQKVDHLSGKSSQTFWQVIQREACATRVRLHPITGRSHQLRVHMLAMGHPILGDRLYANEQALAMAIRLQLHAHKLSFNHPVDGRRLQFESPCPF
ncbi:bifunctional tRNA pseudouridine(32) synthase/23S rRNA pseudouridine(746) synthase RluA [Gayadomonas joobiniege]|uniref:bifunctional tRNA pseudouridine(32) synthase/23S rRNA pseudouridine(746) synthase RluA n=1 Tax=Gayadomonas joobiniege TaxID=1234606 RepID=UPI0003644B69|nr:bifunctional tRNA pseudouridine(32) synthase/23S rRNA pseudouridine(746) synthase RluA [Gayadomonas joobiniege]